MIPHATGAEKPAFRKDINAIRALAVALVVLYHFRIPGFDAGFVGVDVFLVISGYLMTAIIVERLDARRFSFRSFYLARVRRIVPALAGLCVVLLALGWFALSSVEYRELAIQTVASLGFWSNFHYLLGSGYFDLASHEKLLLHTWSLSLEGQFYLLYPVVLALTHRFASRATFRRILWWIALISFAACVLETHAKPASAFFLLPTRAWQFIAGGLVLLHARDLDLTLPVRRWMQACGGGVIVAVAFALDSAAWPGAWAILPTLGASMILLANVQKSSVAAHPVVQWIGTRSYSIYLWHWPIAVVLFQFQLERDVMPIAFGIVLSILLGHLSYSLLERRHAVEHRIPIRPLGRVAGLAWLGSAAIAGAIVIDQGVPGRMPADVDGAAAEARNRHSDVAECVANLGGPGTVCDYGQGPLKAILIGDSHALAIASGFGAFRSSKGRLASWIYPGCLNVSTAMMVPGVFRSGQRCEEFNRWIKQTLAAVDPSVPVIIVNRTSAYIAGFPEDRSRTEPVPAVHFGVPQRASTDEFKREFIDAYAQSACELAHSRTVYLMRPIPEMAVDVPRYVARQIAMGLRQFPSISIDDYRQRHHVVIAAQDRAARDCGVEILDPTTVLCPDDRCRSEFDGQPIYFDDDHLSRRGSELLAPLIATAWERDGISASARAAKLNDSTEIRLP